MTSSRWAQVRAALEVALEVPERERSDAIARMCGDPELRGEVEALLRAQDDAAERFRTGPSRGAAELSDAVEGSRLVGHHAGPYRLVELIATGGMGEVFRAVRDDGEFERIVAVKLIRRSVLSAEARSRFAGERRLLARLSHPNIAALLDGGQLGDRPYIVLEYVEGMPIREYCREHALPIRERAGLMRTTCDAVAHAHQNLIVHRDLKPSNVLITSDGRVKLVDFGISKLLGEPASDLTIAAGQVFTPRYASPEQLRGEPVTTASDVYSLGVILHETLTERTWCSDGTSSTPQLAGEIERPSLANPGVDRELEAILLQALAPEPGRRYPSAEAMGVDLQRYLDGERVLAYPATRAYRVRKWVQRYRAACVSAAVAALLLTTAALTSSIMAARLASERGRTLAAKEQAEETSGFLTGMLKSAGDRAVVGQLTLQGMLDDAVLRLNAGTPGDAAVRGTLHAAIGRAYADMGRSSDAGPQFAAAVRDLAATCGELDERTCAARQDYARYLMVKGDFGASEAEFTRLLEVRRKLGDGGALSRALCLRGMLDFIQRRPERAVEYFGEALRVAEGAHADVAAAAALRSLGAVAIYQSKGVDAVEYRRRALDAQRRATGESGPETADAIGGLGEAYEAAGDLSGAESLFRQALAMTTEAQGGARAAASANERSLARVLESEGQTKEAERTYLDGIRMLEAGLPAARHDWVYLRENYAMFLVRQGRPAEALPHFELAARTYEELLGPDHQRTQMAKLAIHEIENNRSAASGLPEASQIAKVRK